MSRDVSHAIVLAAGLGTRMRPLTDTLPKPLVPAAGRTLIDRTLDHLVAAGIDTAVVNLHYRSGQLRAHLAERAAPRILFSDETEALLETGGGVVKALPLLGETPFLAVNSDGIWLGADPFRPLLKGWWESELDALLLLAPRKSAIGHAGIGDFHLRPDGHVVRRTGDAPAPYVYTGAQLIRPAAFAGAPEGAFSMNVIWDALIARGRVQGLLHLDGWCDVGTPQGLAEAERALG